MRGGGRRGAGAGGLRRAGADKGAINTRATERPELISNLARVYGSQCTVPSIEAKHRVGGGGRADHWEAFTNNGRDQRVNFSDGFANVGGDAFNASTSEGRDTFTFEYRITTKPPPPIQPLSPAEDHQQEWLRA